MFRIRFWFLNFLFVIIVCFLQFLASFVLRACLFLSFIPILDFSRFLIRIYSRFLMFFLSVFLLYAFLFLSPFSFLFVFIAVFSYFIGRIVSSSFSSTLPSHFLVSSVSLLLWHLLINFHIRLSFIVHCFILSLSLSVFHLT